jgi:hypothetical protein
MSLRGLNKQIINQNLEKKDKRGENSSKEIEIVRERQKEILEIKS